MGTSSRRPLSTWALAGALAVGALAATASGQERPSRPIPALPRPPKMDGSLKALAPALPLKKVEAADATASFSAKVAWFRDLLVLGVTITDDKVTQGDVLDVTLFFPEAGPTARGHGFRFSLDGQRAPDAEWAAPAFAQLLVTTAAQRTPDGLTIEAAIPARAFPRFPARDALTLDLCLTYVDHDEPGDKGRELSNCRHGSMVDEALKLPPAFRDGLKLKPPPAVVGLEPREKGWVGYAILHYPVWVQSDAPLTHELLQQMVAEQPLAPESAHLNVPPELSFKGRSLYTVVSGKDPYAVQGKCDAEQELRLGMYLVKGRTADRVLEWPAATCALGRATSVALDEEGALTIGYSNGSTANFTWANDRFERTEIGER